MSREAHNTSLPPMTASLLKTGEWSDMIIKCGEKSFNVHRVIVGLQSKLLTAHLKHECIESTTGIIDLQDDEPEIVKLLIDFLYTGNFDISTDEQVEKVETNKGDGSSNVTDTLQDDENSGSGSSEDLITAVKVYIIADKYDIHPLKLLSKTKYEALLPSHWNSSAFIDSLKLIFDETTENDRLLKDVVVDFAGGKSRELMERSEFVNLLKDNAEMAVEIFKASLLKAPKVMLRLPNPACAICGSSTSVEPANKKFQQATTNPGDMVWWCSSCRCRFA